MREIKGGSGLRPREALIDKYLATAGMVDASPVPLPAVKGGSRKPDEQVADEATSRHIRNLFGQFLYIAQGRVDLPWVCQRERQHDVKSEHH